MTTSPTKNNIVLIGMPGAGKSTLGVVLAKRLGLGFVDTDLLIQTRTQSQLRQIITRQGLEAFCAIEEATVLSLEVSDTVIATGGSVVYSKKAMEHLRSHGLVFFLDVPLPELEIRIGDPALRGVVITPGQTLPELFSRRRPLYCAYADQRIDCAGHGLETLVTQIVEMLD